MPQLDSMIATQRARAEYLEHNMQLDPRTLCLERSRTEYNRFKYPIILLKIYKRDMMAAYLQSRVLGTLKPCEEVITGAAKYYGYEGDCPSPEHVLRRALVIPNY
jgi:dTDP-4-amino-4,6-dideoxygalactose transaminase